MPSIPSYAIDETTEAELNKVKRALNKMNVINAAHLTDKPLQDPTNGKADDNLLIITRELLELNIALGTLTDALYLDRELITFETFKTENFTNVKENFKRTIKGAAALVGTMKTITKQLNTLAPNFIFVTLSTYTDFRTMFNELANTAENFNKTATDIIQYFVNDGLMKTKGYEKFQVEIMEEQIVKPKKGSTKKGTTKLIPTGTYGDPEWKPRITDAMVIAKIEELKKKDNYDQRFNNPKSKEYLDPTSPDPDVKIKLDNLEKYYLNTALIETGVGDILEPSQYDTEFDITEGREEKDQKRRVKTLEKLNDKIKLVSEPVAKQLMSIIEAFKVLSLTYEGVIKNFNEARVQTTAPAVTGGGYAYQHSVTHGLAHPSHKEMQRYKRSGGGEYM